MAKNSRKIKLLLGLVSLASICTIAVGSVISCSNTSSDSSKNQNSKQILQNKKQNESKQSTITNEISNILLKNKNITLSGYKNQNLQDLLSNNNEKEALKSTITNSVIQEIINSSNTLLNKQDIQNNLKVELPSFNEINSSNDNSIIKVNVYYSNQEVGSVNIYGFSNNISHSLQISFNKANYILNLQDGQTINNFQILPNVKYWQEGYKIQYALTVDNNTVVVSSFSSNINPFTFSKNTFNILVKQNTQYENTNYLTLKLTATIINPDKNKEVSASTMIVVQNSALFLYATTNFNNIQYTNLDCYVNEEYYLNFKQYKTLSNTNSLQYCLVEKSNVAGSDSVTVLSNNQSLSSQIQKTINHISKYAEFGTVTYYLEIKNSSTGNVLLQSNPLNINCNKQGGVIITNPNVDLNTSNLNVNLDETTSCTLTLNSMVPGITYNEWDIYYQISQNNNQWEPITCFCNLFKIKLNNNQLILSNLASNIAINIKLQNNATHLYSNIFSISTSIPNKMWTNFVQDGVNKTLSPNKSYDSINYNIISLSTNQTLNLKFILPNINLSNVQYGWSILQDSGFVSVGSNQAIFTKSWTQSGTYIVRMLITWPNNMKTTPLIYLFKVEVSAQSDQVQNSLTQLKQFISNQTNLENVAYNFFKENPYELLAFIQCIVNSGWMLAPNVTNSDCSSYFKVNSCSFNNNGLLQVNITTLQSFNAEYNGSSTFKTIDAGLTMILTTPFTMSSFSPSISKTGASELNLDIITAVKNLHGQKIGWEFKNSNISSFNSFNSLQDVDIFPQNNVYTMTITNSNSIGSLPNFSSNTNSVTHAITWNMITPDQIQINYTLGGASNIVFDPFIFPNPSSVSYSWYEVSGNELSNSNLSGTLIITTTKSAYQINISSVTQDETFTYYCICTYVINGQTYTSRSQNILVVFSNN